ncbi:hypothetical protein BDW42DRAFT_171919 [Aspergillus taichungensis]|uniref:Uncharacterized protein n=1 Tax=Aspergillus taichungensis TaxID=482145 RepID=A0A2J5HRV6_9EURO|nr:hypothetical protein BDW42DRAFT_171919 [Aspergillus taichungensis]
MECVSNPGDPMALWEETNADAAWNTTIQSWKQQSSKGEGFSQFVSNFLHGPNGMRCTDVGSANRCSQPVDCESVEIAAGVSILTGFAGVNQLHAEAYQAIESVQNGVDGMVGKFTEVFAPQKPDDSTLSKNMWDTMMLVVSFGSSVMFNSRMFNGDPHPRDKWERR